jgi:hypothetical protein
VLDALEIEQEAHAYLQLGKADHIENAIKFLRARLSAPECVCGEPKEKSDSKQTMQLALDALVKWQKICLAKNRSAKELTIPTKAIFALNAALAQGEPK